MLHRLSELFPRPVLSQVVAAALDRHALIALCRNQASGQQIDEGLDKDALVASVLARLDESDQAGRALVSALDEACRRESGLLESVAEAEVAAELEKHRALRFRRQGAKLVWALARDGRPVVMRAAAGVIRDYLENLERLSLAREGARQKGAAEELAAVEQSYREAADRLMHLEDELSSVSRERAQLKGEVESRESALKLEREQHEQLRAEVTRLEQECARLTVVTAAPPKPGGATPAPEESPEPLVEAPGQRLARQRLGGPGSRVGVFLDVANLSGAGRRLYSQAVDFRKVLSVVVGKRRLLEARAYVIDKGKDKQGFDSFSRALRAAGYKVLSKRPKIFPDGTMKADWDVGMTVDLLSGADRFDVVVLGSGDGDFAPVASALKQRGVRVEIASFGERTAAELVRVADQHIDLDATVLES